MSIQSISQIRFALLLLCAACGGAKTAASDPPGTGGSPLSPAMPAGSSMPPMATNGTANLPPAAGAAGVPAGSPASMSNPAPGAVGTGGAVAASGTGGGGVPAGGGGGSGAAGTGGAAAAGSGGAAAAGTGGAGAAPGVCGGTTPHGCFVPRAGNHPMCPAQSPEQSAFYPPAAEWKGCNGIMPTACCGGDPAAVCSYEGKPGQIATCLCDTGLHWLCAYPL